MRTSTFPLASAVILSSLAAFVFAPTTVGCSSASDDDSASGDQAATSSAADLQTAKSVVSMLGGDDGKCKSCHGVTEAKVKAWGAALQDTDAKCFADSSLSPMARIDCLRATPGTASSAFDPHRLGLYASGVQTQQFKDAFAAAYPADQGVAEYKAFATKTQMPKAGTLMTDAEFGMVKQWVLKGMPQIDQAFGAPSTDPTPSANCTPSTTPELAAHIAAMKTQGWGAKLADQATPMYGCSGGADATTCLTDLPDATATFGSTAVPQKLRTLHSQTLESHYWVRSSADGKYVGMGFNDSARVIDLSKPASAAPIEVEADYDPYFLPSNDGFAFAGSHEDGSIVLCKQSLLADVADSASPHVSLTESKCASMSQNVYMSIGTSLDGLRYFMTYGSHANDDGGNDITSQLGAGFGANASTALIPMVNNGQSYKAQAGITMKIPNEGDMMMSPSSKLSATRFGDSTHSFGYNVRFINPTFSASGALSVTTPAAATICMPGQKVGFSFDERFMVTHQYVDRTQPDQAQLPAGSSNIMLADLVTGKLVRITNTKAGQYALYPHFRADGWLYFLVRDMNANKEYVVASDAAIRAEAAAP